MSDAVMVPREEMKFAIAQAIWELDRNESTAARMLMVAAQNLLTAASTPVGGWEDISTAPKDGTMFLARCGDWTPFECEWDGDRFVHMDPEDGPIAYKPDQWHPLNRCPNCNGFGFLDAPPPPSVSTGSRPQEAVPTELSDADGVVLCEGDTVEFIRDTNGHFRGERATVTYAFPVPMIGGWTAPHPSCFRHVRQPADGCSSNEGAG